MPQASTGNDTQQPSTSNIDPTIGESPPMASSAKRKRTIEDSAAPTRSSHVDFDGSRLPVLPDEILLQAIIDQHFSKVHHWIPILHQGTFRAKLIDMAGQSELGVLLHALVSASIRHVAIEKYDMSEEEMYRQIRVSRNVVMLKAMEVPSVENLQALVILAFDLVSTMI